MLLEWPINRVVTMSKLRNAVAVLLCLFLLPTLPTTVGAEPIVIDEFVGGITEKTLNFTTSLTNSSLSIEIPAGAQIQDASLVLEGIGGTGDLSSKLDYNNGILDTDVWAHWNEGQGLYPPSVNPTNHRWNKIGNRDIPSLKADDSQFWYTLTTDNGQPPFAWPIQLCRFAPNSAGAEEIKVAWNGYSYNGINRTDPFHAEIWLYNHTTSKWIEVTQYSSPLKGEVWLNYSFSLPSPYLSNDGDVAVAIVGSHSQWAGPMLPAFDVGHLWTDYIVLEVSGRSGIQYPEDVTLTIDGEEIASVDGNISDPVLLNDDVNFAANLQQVIDSYTIKPGNITLDLDISVGRPTVGTLTVRNLMITYEPVVNMPPVFIGPESVELIEDSDWAEILDLDAAFDDDHNRGVLEYELMDLSEYPNPPPPIDFRLAYGAGNNMTLEAKPNPNYYGDFEVPYAVRATDLFDASVVGTVDLTVLPVGDRPIMEEPGILEAFERTPFHYQMNVTDVDLPDDSFTFSDDTEMFEINETTGSIDWTPGPTEIGSHSFHVTVTDSYGFTDQVLATINVQNSNDPPVITSGLELATTQGEQASYIIRAVDPDVPFGDSIQYFAFADAIEFSLDPSTGRITFMPNNDHVPSFQITIQVQDLLGELDEQVLIVTVANVNDPPTFTIPSELTYDQGDDVTYQLIVQDPDLGLDIPEPEVITFSGTGLDAFLPDDGGLISFVPDQSMVGSTDITYTVRDRGGLTDVVTLRWTIIDVNDVPIITDVTSPVEAMEDSEFTLTLEAFDPDGDDIAWEDDSDLFDINPVSGEISFTPGQTEVGTHQVSIIVDDGIEEDSITFTLEVVNVNDVPVITSVLPSDGSSFEDGDKIPFTALASDEDGDALVYTWRAGNKVLGTGASLPYDKLGAGTHKITLEVADGNGGITTSQLTVKVEAALTSSLALPLAAMVAVVAVVGAALYMRSRSKGGSALEESPVEDPASGTDDPVGKVEYRITGTLEGTTVEAPETELSSDTGTDSAPLHDNGLENAQVYELEKAETYKPENE
jgi:hypothetical protein